MSTGPHTPPPPPSPGRTHEERRDAAAIAGSYGRSASPLASQPRIENYWKQNGVKRLTDRQRRRGVKKARRESVRYLASFGLAARVWK